MAWIEVHQSLLTHRKTVLASRNLGIPKVQMVGHMVALWLWALDNAPTGTVQPPANVMIEFAAEWTGEPHDFAKALAEAGFLTFDHDGSVTITNWHEYTGKLLDRRAMNAERMRIARATNVRSTVHERVELPNPTVPNPTVPTPVTPLALSVESVKTKKPLVDAEFIERMVVEWAGKYASADAIRTAIAEACNHVAYDKRKNKQLYVQTWLRRDAEGGNTNGRTGIAGGHSETDRKGRDGTGWG